MANILVTGGAGYVGIMLVRALLEQGHRVTILDNFMYGYESVLHLFPNPNLSVIKYDIRNRLDGILEPFQVVYHLAGISGYPACEANPSSAQYINVDATRNIVNHLTSGQTLIYASTTSFYGNAQSICDENAPIKPISLYGITKYEAEKIVMNRKNSIALRFATIFGVSPRMRVDLLVNDFVYKAVHERSIVIFEGKTKRTFVHLRDAVDAYLLAMDKRNEMMDQVFNVGDESMNYSKLEIARRVEAQTKCTVVDSQMSDIDYRNFEVNFSKIKRHGYRVKISLDEGIQELVKLYQFYKPFSTFQII